MKSQESKALEVRTKCVEVLTEDGTGIRGELLLWNEDPDDRKLGRIVLKVKEAEFSRSNVSFFHALRDIRLELEAKKLLLKCYGSSRHVWPSGMGLSMARGEKAYKTFLGQRGDIKDIVSIFDMGPDVYPCKWEEQCQFHQKWLLSLGIDLNKKLIPWRSLFMQRPVKTLMLYLKEKFHKA